MAGNRDKNSKAGKDSGGLNSGRVANFNRISIFPRLYVSEAVILDPSRKLDKETVNRIRLYVEHLPERVDAKKSNLKGALVSKFKETEVGALYFRLSKMSASEGEGSNEQPGDLSERVLRQVVGGAAQTVSEVASGLTENFSIQLEQLRDMYVQLNAFLDVAVTSAKSSFGAYQNALSDLEDASYLDVLERETQAYEALGRDLTRALNERVVPHVRTFVTSDLPHSVHDTIHAVIEAVISDLKRSSIIHAGKGVDRYPDDGVYANVPESILVGNEERIRLSAAVGPVTELFNQIELCVLNALLCAYQGNPALDTTVYIPSILNDGVVLDLGKVINSMNLRDRLVRTAGLSAEQAELVMNEVKAGDLQAVLNLIYRDGGDKPTTVDSFVWNGITYTRRNPTEDEGWRFISEGNLKIWFSVDPTTGKSDSDVCYLLRTKVQDSVTYYAMQPVLRSSGIFTGGMQYGD